MRVALCAFLLVALAAHARPLRRRVLVEAVEIEGNRRLSDEELYARLATRPGDPYDERQVHRDFQTLLDLGVFDTTATRLVTEDGVRGGKVVVFQVSELPLVDGLKFRGLPRGLAVADVLKALRAKGIRLEKGSVYDPAALPRALGVVRALLSARGLSDMSAESYIKISPGHVSVLIQVTKGRAF